MSKYHELQKCLERNLSRSLLPCLIFSWSLRWWEMGLHCALEWWERGSGSMSLETRIKMKKNISFAACSQSQWFNHWFIGVGYCWYLYIYIYISYLSFDGKCLLSHWRWKKYEMVALGQTCRGMKIRRILPYHIMEPDTWSPSNQLNS